MRTSESIASHRLARPKPPASRFARWSVLAVLALAFAASVTAWTGTASYDEQLSEVVAQRGLTGEAFDASRGSPALRQLFLESTGNRELQLKLELALDKYPVAGRRVLEAFGSDAPFQDILLAYGEGVIPVIDYFMTTDLATLDAKDKLADVWKSGIALFQSEQAPGSEPQSPIDRSRLRGIYAIEAIRVDGHHFLGQFVLDKEGRIQRVQTDRVLESVKSIFTSGITGLETKYKKGEPRSAADYVWAGVDVLAVFGLAKGAQVVAKASVAGKAAEGAAVARRTTVAGRSVLLSGAIGKRVATMGAKASSVFLVLRHPRLLSGVFAELAASIGAAVWAVVLGGWWMFMLVLGVLIVPLLRVLLTPIRWIAGGAAWVLTGRASLSRN